MIALQIAMAMKYLTLLMSIGFILGRIFYGHYVCLLYKEYGVINSIAKIFGDAEFHITDNFHRCRDKFLSILEI